LRREDRFAARLAEGRMAWFPANVRGRRRLQRERRVLGLIAEHCTFQAPRVLQVADAGWDVRALVEGPFEPRRVYERVKSDAGYARRVGEALGAIIAELHTAIPAQALAGRWLPRRASWPEPLAYAERRLPMVTGDTALIRRSLTLLERYEAAEAAVSERVLTHGDLGFHNAVVDPQTGAVAGVFDFDGATLCDRCHDFKYLLLDDSAEALLDGAIGVYEHQTGKTIDRDRVRLLNAACAVGFLAYRAGSGPEETPAGRTLAEDLRWTRMALNRAGA
jgi:aminoglycoside phosphotransferase (APT) family kinase protein